MDKFLANTTYNNKHTYKRKLNSFYKEPESTMKNIPTKKITGSDDFTCKYTKLF